MTITPQELVNREVGHCVSALVSTLAQGYGAAITHVDAYGRRSTNGGDLANLTEQAFELASPIDDWEEAAIQAGWEGKPKAFTFPGLEATYVADSWQELCELEEIEPCQREVFEHWLVSDWLADKLEAHGEKVDRDFAGLTVWARTTTGQAIYADGVFDAICAEMAANA